MDLEHLNKKQIVLLTLLVSFMTSIATGIVTVSLMAQVPPPVTQTINRVVERTLERVVEKKKDEKGNITTKEKTVVVQETDLISKAVQSAMPSLVSVYVIERAPASSTNKDAQTNTTAGAQTAAIGDSTKDLSKVAENLKTDDTPPKETNGTLSPKEVRRFVARGVFITDSTIVTDAGALPEGAEIEVVTTTAHTSLKVKFVSKKGRIATITVAPKSGVALQRGDAQALQLGGTLVALAGEDRVQVATGVVSDLDRSDAKKVIGLSLDMLPLGPGAVLVNLEGRLIALYVGDAWMLQ